MKFTAEYRVDTHQTDLNGIATVTSVMQYMQETANLQHEVYGPKLDELRAIGKSFILSRAALDLHKPLYGQDRVTVVSWLNEAKGYGYFRNSILKRGEEIVAEMASFWGVMDLESRHPLRAEEIPLGFGTDSEPLTTKMPMRFRIPKTPEMALLGEHKVVYSDCDMNRHMNNTRYPGMFTDFADGMLGRRVTGFAINYQNEARIGSTFKVFGMSENGTAYFHTVLDNELIGADAMMTFGDDL